MRAFVSDPRRLRRFGAALAVALFAAVAIVVATAQGVETRFGGRLGGDFPAFYVAGQIAREDVSLLLDLDVQRERIEPYFENAVAPFPYPPAFAYLLAPLTFVPYRFAYALAVLGLAAAGGLAAYVLCDLFGVRSRMWRQVAVLGTITFVPVFRSFAGAQNGTITLSILVIGWWLLARDRPYLAGVALGALWFKPQFAVPILLLVVVGGWRRTALGMAAAGVGAYLVHLLLLGPGWVVDWYSSIVTFADQGNRANQVGASISPVEFLRGMIHGTGGDLVGYGTAAILGAAFAWWFSKDTDLDDRLVIGALALMLTAPHALTYEACLLVPVIGLWIAREGRSALPRAVLYYLAGVIALLPVHPLLRTGYVLVSGWLWWRTTRHEDHESRRPPLIAAWGAGR